VTPDDLLEAESASRQALEPFIARDWPVRAGDLTWDVRTTVAHVCDAGGWYAAHLALQSPRRLRVDFRVHPDASNAELLDVLPTAAATLAGVARASPHGARAYHNAGMADTSDFLAMGCDEILVHCWDAVRGFGGKFAPPEDVAERILRRLFPWAPTNEPPGRPCYGRTGVPTSSARSVWGPTGSGIARRSMSGTEPSLAMIRTHPTAMNGTKMPADGIQPGKGSVRAR
jgi:hypothetical protein